MSPFVAYHGVTADQHQARVDELAPQGFRPVSLSVSGSASNPRYAAVWFQRPGPGWWAVHGLSPDAYQARFDELVGQGYAPVLVSAAGAPGDEVFAALFEQGVTVGWYARHGLRWDNAAAPGSVNFENQRAFDEGYLPGCLAVYGTPEEPHFAGVWVANTEPVPWAWWWTDPVIYQRYFDAEVRAGCRPAYVSVAPSGWLVSVFRDEPVGEWWARHGMTPDDYQAEFDARNADGAEPLVVQAGETGAGTRYVSIFVRDDAVIARSWNVTGATFTAADELDAAVRSFMVSHAIRAMSIAIARNGTLLGNRGYTWAEPWYPVTQPDTLFRVASVSKLFTCAAADGLINTGRLASNAPAFALLGITSKLVASQTPDPDVGRVTVHDLAVRQSGLPHDYDADYRTIAGQLGHPATAPTRDELVRYVYGQPLVARPGTGDNYSNSAINVLTSIVELIEQRPLVDALRAGPLGDLGISDVFVAATAENARRPGEVATYDHPGVSLSQVDMAADALAPNAYGGQVVTEVSEGAGGLVMSTGTVARFIATHAVWNIGGREAATRYGEMDGTGAGAVSRPDGLDFSFAFNRRVTTPELDGITGEIHTFLNAHGSALGVG